MYLAPLNYDRFFKKIFSNLEIAKQFLEDFFGFEIEEIELLPTDHKMTNEASLLNFDYRCKIKQKFIIIEMQQWYKHDVVKRFYLYHAANTVLQLESLPLIKIEKERKIKDYRELLPVYTLIWTVDDGLKFNRDYTSYSLLPIELLNFLQNKPLWDGMDCEEIKKKREDLLKIVNNDAKGLTFLRESRLIFAFQNYIIKEKASQIKPYTKWFKFAHKTKDRDNTKEDFKEFENDPVFSEIIRRLNHKSLNKTDWDYIRYYDEMLGVMEAKVRDAREEGIEEGLEQGLKQGLEQGQNKGQQIGSIKTKIELIIEILLNFPSWKNEQISNMVKVEIELVEKIRHIFEQKDEESIKTFIPILFKDISHLSDKDTDKLHSWLLKLWEKFHKDNI